MIYLRSIGAGHGSMGKVVNRLALLFIDNLYLLTIGISWLPFGSTVER